MERLALTDRGQIPADADLDHVLAVGDELELIAVWNTFHDRQLTHLTLDRMAHDPDSPDRQLATRELRDELDRTAAVTAVHALTANRRLVELFTGRRWSVIQTAREAGASWTTIGEALGMSRQAAHEWYQRKIERQERYVPDLHDAPRARAALDDTVIEEGSA